MAMHRRERVLGGNLEVPGMAEEAREARGDQSNQLPTGERVAFFCSAEERFNAGGGGEPEPPATAGEKLAMPLTQLDASQPQSELPGPLKLFEGQHYH